MSRQPEESIRYGRSVPHGADRLLRAIDELRALEREKQQAPAWSRPFLDLQRRVEAKAREVFRMADEPDDEADRSASHS